MLKTVETSRAQKTKGLAVTYRAGSQEKFGTCPASCELNPSGCGASKVDQEYLERSKLPMPFQLRGSRLLIRIFPRSIGLRKTGREKLS